MLANAWNFPSDSADYRPICMNPGEIGESRVDWGLSKFNHSSTTDVPCLHRWPRVIRMQPSINYSHHRKFHETSCVGPSLNCMNHIFLPLKII